MPVARHNAPVRLATKLLGFLCIASMTHLACSSDTNVIIARAPNFDLSSASVSVFGVYSEGRWNPSEWDKLGRRLSSLGAGPCEPGFNDSLRNNDKELFNAIDREARSNGVTDKMLVQLSAGAQGDLVLIIELWGALGAITDNSSPAAPTTGGPTAGAMGGPSGTGGMAGGRMRPGYGGGGGGYGPMPAPRARQQDALKMVARVFAPETNEWVGAVELQYSGSDPNEAIAKFDEALGQLLPGSHCGGWSWKAPASAATSSSASVSPAPSTSASTIP